MARRPERFIPKARVNAEGMTGWHAAKQRIRENKTKELFILLE